MGYCDWLWYREQEEYEKVNKAFCCLCVFLQSKISL